MTRDRFRTLVLSLDGVEERPHMERTAFRTKRKIFATLGDDDHVNVAIHPEETREALLAAYPGVFSSLGGWTRLGYVAVNLKEKIDDELLRSVLVDAWRDALPVGKPKKPRAAKR